MNIREHECLGGERIEQACEDIAKIANETGDRVWCNFNDIRVEVGPGEDPKTVSDRYMAESKRRHEEYLASPEYKQKQIEAKKRQEEREAALADALASAPESMTTREPEKWQEWRDSNTDPYGACTVRYADKWARIMEARIARGLTLDECAEDASHLADDEGITGFMYGCAVSMLSQVWVHGEALRRWHNLKTQIGTEGEMANEEGGVLNPSTLRIG